VSQQATKRDPLAPYIRKMERLRLALGKNRDALRDLADDIDALKSDADEADDALAAAIEVLRNADETLSKFV